ncbi:hypothetical protein [Enterovibrio baiacu]|uniref:hypothetical protein n=1 Tax=Enterovibrio baiacu TaxID=2491023 RepID=UPI0010131C91|nr:hypothetical protein [Enterovibrio baiacu]MBE1275645.1 hypothetical protein [Enterovibrio baiacu]
MNLKTTAIVIALSSVGVFLLLDNLNANISTDGIKDFVSVLQNVSAMIFAIVGLWVSSTYPTTVTSLTQRSDKVKNGDFGENTKRLELLVTVLVVSAAVMASLLIFQAAKMILPGLIDLKPHLLTLKYISVSILFGLGACQFMAVIYVIVINVTYINDLYKKIHNKDIDDQF